MTHCTRKAQRLTSTLVLSALLVGCGNSDSFVFTNPSTPNQPAIPAPAQPVAVDDAFNALGNATVNFTAANGVLTNDTVNGATISEFDAVGPGPLDVPGPTGR